MSEEKNMEDKMDLEMEDIKKKEKKNRRKPNKTTQNYLAVIILLVGLLAGSVFVDVAQMVKGEGISKKVLDGKDAVEYAGKTWVAYNDPIVDLTIVNDETCETCKTESAVLGLKAAIPTVVPREISVNSDEGKALLAKAQSKTIPVFVFGKAIEKTDVFSKIQNMLTQKDDMYLLDTSVLGISGKYTQTPPFESKNQEVLGNKDAKVSIIEFSDFQCPYCKLFYQALDQLVKQDEYKNKVKVSFKNLPLSFHPRANDAALAVECSGEQGKFWDMYNTLFSKQDDWKSTTNKDKFKTYAAQLKLDTAKFNKCIDNAETQADIDADKNLAKDFNISGTPAIFINDEFVSGAIKYDELKAKIDSLLGNKPAAAPVAPTAPTPAAPAPQK